MSKTRVYVVTDESLGPAGDDHVVLVRAESIAQVRRWILNGFTIRQATTDELIEALQDNEQLADATAEPADFDRIQVQDIRENQEAGGE